MKNKMHRGFPPSLLSLALAASGGAWAEAEPVPVPAPAPEQLPMVVVSATRHAMLLVDAPAAISVVSAQQIAARGADNVLEAVRGETGVSVFGRTISGRKTLSLRGMDARHTLILVDGKRIGASDGVIGHSDFQIDWLNMGDVDRIEVLRGPLSVLYGAEALGGVVQLFSKAPARQWEGSALLEGSQAAGDRGGDGRRAAVRLSGPLSEQLRGTLSASDSRRDAVVSPLDARISDIEGRHKKEASLRLQWEPLRDQVFDLEHRAGREDREAFAVEKSGKKRVYESDTDIRREHTSFGWSADWGGANEWRSLLRYYQSRFEMQNSRGNGVTALRPNTLLDRVLETQASMRWDAAQLLSAGAELRSERLDNVGLPGGSSSASHRSLHLQDEIELARSLTLTAGLRHDHHERFGSHLSPRLYAVWHPAEGWTLKGGYSTGFKPPTLKQITPGYQEDEGPYTYVSQPALRPETNRAQELGLGFERGGRSVQLMVFDNRLRDLIVPQLIGIVAGRQTYRFENIDRAHLRGAELSGRSELGGGFSAQLGYQYLDARDGNGQRLEKRPRHSLGAALDWASGPWRAGLRVDRVMDQTIASPVVGQAPLPLPDLTQISAQLSRKLSRQLDLSLGVNNAGNTILAQKSPLFTWAEAPRTWRLSLRGQW
ncbi:TonB-dependent receptor plug domain-containing protein [Roseateles microcysteis]|uniref:TonB-dependent receptor plug domain-containing protein n=1 Tax=Roseateles microcysteis TaxID=3119057 RepID=UPI002FE5D8E4